MILGSFYEIKERNILCNMYNSMEGDENKDSKKNKVKKFQAREDEMKKEDRFIKKYRSEEIIISLKQSTTNYEGRRRHSFLLLEKKTE